MRLTTKGRYAVMAMVDIARNDSDIPTNLATIAANQNIDIGYLEKIFSILRRKGLVKSIKGPGGGYILVNNSNSIYVNEIIKAVDENIIMTRCNNYGKHCINSVEKCLTHDLWEGLGNHIKSYLSSISLADICNKEK